MKACICERLYHVNTATTTAEYAFSGSLCCIRSFETVDGIRYCLTIFSISDYKHLHFPHDEYKWLISTLQAQYSTQAICPTTINTDMLKLNDGVVLSIKDLPFDGIKIKTRFGKRILSIGPVTSFGLVKSTPFGNVNVFSVNENQFACDSMWDICTCASCPVFKRLIEYEASDLCEKPENMIFV